MMCKILLFLSILSASSIAFSQQPEFQQERKYFDFLIGEWTVRSAENATEKWKGDGKDRFKFAKAIDGNVIVSEWYFNRGTPAKPNFSKALYNMGFDNASQTWTFYYLSPLSSQFYQGKFENGTWNFYRSFHLNGKAFVQRQNWRSMGDRLVQRTIENSEDEGKTWARNYQGIFKRIK